MRKKGLELVEGEKQKEKTGVRDGAGGGDKERWDERAREEKNRERAQIGGKGGRKRRGEGEKGEGRGGKEGKKKG